MAADANIFAQYLRPVKSMQDYSNDMDAAEQNRLTLAAGRMKAQQDQQAVEDDNALRAAYQQSGGDNNALLKILQGGGRYKAAEAVQKRIQEQLKGKSELDTADVNRRKVETEIIDKSLGTAKTFAGQMVDKAGGASYLNGLYADPVLGPLAQRMKPLQQALSEIPDDPAEFLRWKAGHMNVTADKLLSLLTPKTDITNMGANQSFGSTDQFTGQRTQTGSAPILQSANNAATIAAQAEQGDKTRAQALKVAGMVDARSRDATASALSKPFEVTGPDGNPVLVRQDKQGNITPVSGYGPKGGAEKPLNDTQSKALLFGSRMREAGKVLDSLAKDGTLASVPGSRSGYGVGATVTALSSSKQQQLDQAKRDFVNAVLRRESGAVIADSEFENADKQYFPQIGDSKAVVEQKKRNRELATNGILQEVPENRRNGLQPQAQMPTADDVRKQADNILKGG